MCLESVPLCDDRMHWNDTSFHTLSDSRLSKWVSLRHLHDQNSPSMGDNKLHIIFSTAIYTQLTKFHSCLRLRIIMLHQSVYHTFSVWISNLFARDDIPHFSEWPHKRNALTFINQKSKMDSLCRLRVFIPWTHRKLNFRNHLKTRSTLSNFNKLSNHRMNGSRNSTRHFARISWLQLVLQWSWFATLVWSGKRLPLWSKTTVIQRAITQILFTICTWNTSMCTETIFSKIPKYIWTH